MGGAACVIIINCGALKSKAAELYEFPYEDLKPIAREMYEFEGELCDNAEILTAGLTASQVASLIEEADRSWAFGRDVMQPFMDSNGKRSAPEVEDLWQRMRAFLNAQEEFFRSLLYSGALPEMPLGG